MKELSTEEKAQRYDEAFTKAKNIVNSINVGLIGKDSFEAVFPELKESEDERIRKELLAWLKSTDGQTLPMDRYNAAIAWLEKQKVLTTEDDLQGKEDVLWCIKQAKKYAKNENERGTCWFAEKWLEKAMADAGYTFDFEKKELKKIEQKPVEWSDDEIEEWIGCEAFPEGTNITPLPDAIKIVKKTAHHFYKLGIKHRNTQNWTDEDETNLNTVTKSCIRAGNYYLVDWLKSLKDKIQPQERVEWSEEDERMVTRIVESLSAYADKLQYEGFCHNSEVLYEQTDWLKSLRPKSQLKPSDEQMDALETAVSSLQSTALESLYQDLKRL